MLRLVALSAGTSVGLGILAGLALSFGMNRLIARWIESGTRDPLVILAVSLVLFVVAAAACLVPAEGADNRSNGRLALRVAGSRLRSAFSHHLSTADSTVS